MGLTKLLYSGEDVVIPIFDQWLRRYLGVNLSPSEWQNRYLELSAARKIKFGYVALSLAVLLVGLCWVRFGNSPMPWLWAELMLIVIPVYGRLTCGKLFWAERRFLADYCQLTELLPGKMFCCLEVDEVRQPAEKELRERLFRCQSALQKDPALKKVETIRLCYDYGRKVEVLKRFGFWNAFGGDKESALPVIAPIPITGVQTVPIPEG